MSDKNGLVIVEYFYNPVEAHVVKTFLESHDIPVFLFDESMTVGTTLDIAVDGIKMLVLQEDVEEAKRLIIEQKQTGTPSEHD